MAQPELRRRLSMSSDVQWTNRGRTITSSGYALSPTSANTGELDTVDPPTTSPPTSPGSSNGSVHTRQLNASSIFARLGLADPSSLPIPAGPARSGSSSSSSSSTLHGVRGLSSFEGLKVGDDITPTVNGGKEATSYMDASNSDHHLGRASADNETPTKMMPIEADILLPFADRPSEVRELLEDTERNRGLYELLKETFTVRSANNTSMNLTTAVTELSASPPSSPSVSPAPEEGTTSESSSTALPAKTLNLLRSQEHKRQDSTSTVTPTTLTGEFHPSSSSSSKRWDFSDLQSHLQIPRSVLCDQDWIDILKANVYARSLLLWERLRACLGVDVDDEQGGDRYEPLSSDIEPPGMEGVGQMSRSASSNSNLDLLLSPRAILSRMASSNSSTNNTSDNPPMSALSSVFSSSFDTNAFLPSPSGFSANNNLNAFSFSSPQKGSSSTQPMSIPNASYASPSRSPNFSLKELESPSSPSVPVSRSPVTSTSTSMAAAARNHRRSPSGGSSFRKAFAMSSINEDSPLDNFESRDTPLTPSAGSGSKTPENELQQQASVNDTVRNDGKVDLGSLLRLKGFGVGDVAPPPLSSTNSSVPPFSPQLASSTAPSSSYGATNAAAPGHLPPPTPLSPTMSMSRSFSASSLSGSGIPRSPNFSTSPFVPSTSSSSALGLKLANPTPIAGSQSSNSSSAANSPTKSMQKYRDSRRDSYDEYISVFGGSEEERSVSGASVQSRGQGPHMRFSFGSQDAATPALNGPRGGSGFALAGLQSAGRKNPASARVVAVKESGSGNSTPKAR